MNKRTTKQKLALQEAMSRMRSFFSAEDLYHNASKGNPAIGLATTYRFLKEGEKNHAVHSFLCGNHRIFSTNSKNHCHFTCETCGKVEHLPLKKMDFLKDIASGTVCHLQVDINGICKDCTST